MQSLQMDAKQHQWFLNALKRKNSLYCRIDVWGFVSAMLALLFLLMPNGYHDLPRYSVDLAETRHAIPMPGAAREDAMRISITRARSTAMPKRFWSSSG